MAQTNEAPLFLFGIYVIEIAKYFGTFRSFNKDDVKEIPNPNAKPGEKPTFTNPNYGQTLPLNVVYGAPKASMRKYLSRYNGMMRTPVLNFYGVDWIRRVEKEPIMRLVNKKESRELGHAVVRRPPMQFDVNYSFSLFTSSTTERDHILYQIYTAFPRNELSLIYQDPTNTDPDDFIFIPLKIDLNAQDESELEGLSEKETRDLVRTSFTLTGSHVVPYPSRDYPMIKSIHFVDKMIDPAGDVITKYDMEIVPDADGHIILSLGADIDLSSLRI